MKKGLLLPLILLLSLPAIGQNYDSLSGERVFQLGEVLVTELPYTYLRRKNLTNPGILFTNVPNHKLFGFADLPFHPPKRHLKLLHHRSHQRSQGKRPFAF